MYVAYKNLPRQKTQTICVFSETHTPQTQTKPKMLAKYTNFKLSQTKRSHSHSTKKSNKTRIVKTKLHNRQENESKQTNKQTQTKKRNKNVNNCYLAKIGINDFCHF